MTLPDDFLALGVVRLPAVVTRSTAAAAADYIDGALEDALQSSPRADDPHNFSRVTERRHRYDLKLSTTSPAIRAALNGIVRALKVAGLLSLLGEWPPQLYELGSVVSDPGARLQPLHYDHWLDGRLNVISCFVALQPITEHNGATIVHASSHLLPPYEEYTPADASTASVAEMHPGDALVYDARVRHQGGANRHSRRRILYASFRRRGVALERGTLRHELRALSLDDDRLVAHEAMERRDHGTTLIELRPTATRVAAMVRSVVQEWHMSRALLVRRAVSAWALPFIGWDEVQHYCANGRLASDSLMVASGRDRASGGGMAPFDAEGHAGFPESVGAFVNWTATDRQLDQHGPVALFDLPLPWACPAFMPLLEGHLPYGLSSDWGVRGYKRGHGYPRLYAHPTGSITRAHVDGGGSFFWIWLLRGEKHVHMWDVGALPGGAEGVRVRLRPGDVYVGPVGGYHEVYTAAPSLSVSTNYFPATGEYEPVS